MRSPPARNLTVEPFENRSSKNEMEKGGGTAAPTLGRAHRRFEEDHAGSIALTRIIPVEASRTPVTFTLLFRKS